MKCRQCSEEFEAHNPWVRYCSRFCRSKHDRIARSDKIKAYMKEYSKSGKKKRNAEKDKLSREEWIKKHWHQYILCAAKHRAKKQGSEFNLTVKDIQVPEYCQFTGLKIEPFSENYYARPSLDRIVPELGYTRGNVRVISQAANLLKSDMPEDKFIEVLQYIGGKWKA
jgi:hypothetical protein